MANNSNSTERRLVETTKIGKRCREEINYCKYGSVVVDVGKAKNGKRLQASWTVEDIVDLQDREKIKISGAAIDTMDITVMSVIYTRLVQDDRKRDADRLAGKKLRDPEISIREIMLRINPRIYHSNNGDAATLRTAVTASIGKLMTRLITIDYTDGDMDNVVPGARQAGAKSIRVTGPLLSCKWIDIKLPNGGTCAGIQILPVNDVASDSLALYQYAASIGQIAVVPQPLQLPPPQRFSLQKQAIKDIMAQDILTQIRIAGNRRHTSRRAHTVITVDRLLAQLRTDQQLGSIDHPGRVINYATTLMQMWQHAGLLESYTYQAGYGWQYVLAPATYTDD